MSPVATVIAVSLALGFAPPAPPPTTGAAGEPSPVTPAPIQSAPTQPAPTQPAPIQPAPIQPAPIPEPTIPPPTSTPGAPKRVTLPGSKDPVVLPTPVAPTPVKPTPVVPTGPQPIIPGTEPGETTDPGAGTVSPPPPREPRRSRRARQPRGSGRVDGDTASTGACFAPQSRCRTFVLAGVGMSAAGVAAAAAGAVLISRPVTPIREDPTEVTSYRPPGAVMLAVGGSLLIAGVAVLAAGIVSHRRDQSMRRTAWWRPRMSFGVILP